MNKLLYDYALMIMLPFEAGLIVNSFNGLNILKKVSYTS